MPRTYVPSRKKPYKKYNQDHMRAAIQEYESSTNKSLKEIGKKYNISKSVLHRHISRVMRPHGGQRALKQETEAYIIQYINICSEWGYPLDTYDLRILIKGYLDRMGVEVKKFKNNMPGPDFVGCFLKRHKNSISERISQNIKRARASVSPEVIEDYFKHLETSLKDVPLCNIINYDETNLSDDPGRKKIITKRGVKYPERVMNHSKSSTSLMIAASADGTLLPGYVVYKAAHMYDTWKKNGPRKFRYNRTASGWFDGDTFADWVETVALPYFEDKIGKKLLIGDNLSSHLSIDLIRKCKEKDVFFVFLPANSTHLTQPLDVAFFRPMKSAWRDILFNWKKSDGRTESSVPKNWFPYLLKKLFERLETNIKRNVLAGFAKTGISPLNKEKVLERLPGNVVRNETCTEEERKAIDETVFQLLSEMRYGTGNARNSRITHKKKKLNVQAGKSVAEESDYPESNTSEITSVIDECNSEDANKDNLETNIKSNEEKQNPKPKKRVHDSDTKKKKRNIVKKQNKENSIPAASKKHTEEKSEMKTAKNNDLNKPQVMDDMLEIDNFPIIFEDTLSVLNMDLSVAENITIENDNNCEETNTKGQIQIGLECHALQKKSNIQILSNEPIPSQPLGKVDKTKCNRIPIKTLIKIPNKPCSHPGPSSRKKYCKNDAEILKNLMDADD